MNGYINHLKRNNAMEEGMLNPMMPYFTQLLHTGIVLNNGKPAPSFNIE